MLLLGIDGGGTSTDIRLTSQDGRLCAELSAPGSNVVMHGVRATIAILDEAIGAVLSRAGERDSRIRAAVAGLAGVGRETERRAMGTWFSARFTGRPTGVVTDIELVLAAGTSDGVGLAVVSGTGSVAFARDHRGTVARSGGWGTVIGDPGSGYAIGIAALRAVARAADGMADETKLSRAILDQWGLVCAQDLAAAPGRPTEVAALTTVVAQVAEAGDLVAKAILEAAGSDLATQAAVAVRRLTWPRGTVPCALAGGVLVHVPAVLDSFLSAAANLAVALGPVTVVERPVGGAISLAIGLLRPEGSPG